MLRTLSYWYDAAGHINEYSDNAAGQAMVSGYYDYDGRRRLTGADRVQSGSQAVLHQYEYDDADNMTLMERTGPGGFTRTYGHNNANELTSMTQGGVTTNFSYDAWGRQTQKTRSGSTATYGYRYGQRLHEVTSNFPGEGSRMFD